MYNFEDIKILVVDDEELLREILIETFSMHGALVDSAESGDAAFEKVKANNYDMVISDVRMPSGDGISLMTKINAMNKAKPKLFIYTAYNDLTEQIIKDLNILKVFNKPFSIENLLTQVSNFLAKN